MSTRTLGIKFRLEHARAAFHPVEVSGSLRPVVRLVVSVATGCFAHLACASEPQSSPRLNLPPENQILATHITPLGGRSVIFEKLLAAAVKPVAQPVAVRRDASALPPQTLARKPLHFHSVGGEVRTIAGLPKTFLRYHPGGGRGEVRLWVDADLTLLGCIGEIETAAARHLVFMLVTTEPPPAVRRDPRFAGTYRKLPALPPGDAAVTVIAGRPDAAELELFTSLAERYQRDPVGLRQAYDARLADHRQRLQARIADPPERKNLRIRYRRTDPAALAAEARLRSTR